MRRPQFSLKTMLWLVVVVGAFCAGTRFDRYLAERRMDPNETKIRAALGEKTELDFADRPLEDVIEYLQQRHEINIQLDNKALADAGVGTDVPITRSIKGITLRSALNLLLGELDLTYLVQNGVLMITTKTEAYRTRYAMFSLKTTLWLVAAAAVFLGGIGFERYAAKRRAEIRQNIRPGGEWEQR